MTIRAFLFLLLLLCKIITYAQSKESPSEKYLDRYNDLKEMQASIQIIDEVIDGLPLDSPDKQYFNVLKLMEYTNCCEWRAVDSLYYELNSYFELTQNKLMLSKLFSLYGTALNAKGEYKQACSYLLEKIELVPPSNETPQMIAKHLNFKGAMFYELGFGYLQMEEWEEARHYADRAIESLAEVKDTITLMHAYNLSGLILKRSGHPEYAIERYQRALELIHDHRNNSLGRIILQNIATLYSDMDLLDKALEFSRKIFY